MGAIIALSAIILASLTLVGFAVWFSTGITPAWLFFRSKDDRKLHRMVRGALVMGPEGWERIHENWYKTRAGDIRAGFQFYSCTTATILVGGQEVDLGYEREKQVLGRTIKRWERGHLKRMDKLRKTADVERVANHIIVNRQAFDRMDYEVARQRSQK